jgi:hypothetical protein
MKLTVGLAALSLFLAAAAVEANLLYDFVLHKRYAVHAHACDTAKPGMHCESATIAHPASSSAKLAHKHHYAPSGRVAEAVINAQSGVIHVDPGKCGPIGATGTLSARHLLVAVRLQPHLCTEKVTKLSGPNGHIDWINCGVTGRGWTPPRVELGQLITVPLDNVRHTTFSSCSDEIIATFEKYGKEFDSWCPPKFVI